MPNLLTRIWSSIVGKAEEGQYRPGPYSLPVSGGWLSAEAGKNFNWWQLGYSINGYGVRQAMVEACISAYSQTVSMCQGDHWRRRDDGGRDRITTSALSRILRHPNDYQSISDFMLNATRSLYLDGNTYALALRNDRFEIDELHLMDPRQSSPQVVRYGEGQGDVFYRLGGNSVIDGRAEALELYGTTKHLLVPQRDVLHIRLHSERRWPHPLVGESPLIAAFSDIDSMEKIKDQQDQFYENQARPSAVLTTDHQLDKDQVQALRDRWNEQAKGLHAGGVPILTAGLKVQPWPQAQAARDMQIIERLRLTNEQIALVFRIPLAILGLADGGGRNTEQLMGFWLASGLGFALNHIEEAFGRLYELKGVPDEYVEFDTEALLRSARKDRVDWLVRAVQGGVYSPNEARAREDLPAVEYGEEPRVQQQVVPLSAAAAISPSGGGSGGGGLGGVTVGGPAPPAPPAPAAGAAAASEAVSATKSEKTEKTEKTVLQLKADSEALVQDLISASHEYDRRRVA